MFTFVRFSLLFLAILMCINLCALAVGSHFPWFTFAHILLADSTMITAYCLFLFALAFFPCTNFYLPVICHGQTDKPVVAITFDDGPDTVKTPVILDILQKHDAQATFFCIGMNLARNEHILKRIFAEGHLIGNHSYSHSNWLDLFSSAKIRAELLKTDQLICEIIGKRPLFFRPPFGVVNPTMNRAVNMMHWQTVCWSIRSFDTSASNPEKKIERILKQLKPGAIILLHDFTPFTEIHLARLITGIREAGYTIVALDKLLGLNPYA